MKHKQQPPPETRPPWALIAALALLWLLIGSWTFYWDVSQHKAQTHVRYVNCELDGIVRLCDHEERIEGPLWTRGDKFRTVLIDLLFGPIATAATVIERVDSDPRWSLPAE